MQHWAHGRTAERVRALGRLSSLFPGPCRAADRSWPLRDDRRASSFVVVHDAWVAAGNGRWEWRMVAHLLYDPNVQAAGRGLTGRTILMSRLTIGASL